MSKKAKELKYILMGVSVHAVKRRLQSRIKKNPHDMSAHDQLKQLIEKERHQSQSRREELMS